MAGNTNKKRENMIILKAIFVLILSWTYNEISVLSCDLQQDSSTAAATHPPVSGGYSTFSCTPCDKGQYEVHVINIYEPTGSSRGFRQEPTNVVTVPVEIKSQKAVDIKLVFINYEAAHWVITKSSYVNILAVNVVAYYHTSTTVRLSNNSTLSVEKVRDYHSGWREICKVKNYVTNKYGYMSSFTGVYKSSSFVLTVGTCDVSTTTTTVDPSTIDYTTCLTRKDCWLKYQFSYDNNWNDCHGHQYVTMYRKYYVGVVVCTNAKYKIFISESLTGRYLNVGDEKSNGKNHCEFVGASSESMADHFYQGGPAPNVTGYYRSTWGANISKGTIGGTHWWGIYYVKYYECGVCIPGSKIVVDFNGAGISITSKSTSMSTSMSTVTVSNTDAQSCLQSNNCWLKYNFRYDDNWNSCYGDQYVTLFKQRYYIGVILCSSMRYKIFMSESLSEKFLNIGDGGGHGQDHCEFVGATSEVGVDCDSNFWKSPSTTGYYRYKWGQTIQKGNIGGHPNWTGKYYGKWCECGVAIPGAKQVMSYVGTGTWTIKSTTTSYWTTPFKKFTTAVTWKETDGSDINFDYETSVNIIQIIGIAIGVVILLAIIIGIIVIVLCVVQRQKPRGPTTFAQSNPGVNWNQNAPYPQQMLSPGQLPNQYANRQQQPQQQVSLQQMAAPPPNYYEALRNSKVVGVDSKANQPSPYVSLNNKSQIDHDEYEDATSGKAEEGIYLEINP